MKKESSIVRVVENKNLGGGRFRLKLEASPTHLSCQPGQFFNIAFIDQSPYLPRPFSVYEIFHQQQHIDFLIAVVGQGTHKLAQCQAGDQLLLIGPLGNGFTLGHQTSHHIFIAGSIGLAPFIELHKSLKEASPQTPHTLIYGARSKEELVDVPFLERLDLSLHLCTDDGSYGSHGLVTDILKQQKWPQNSLFYTCGPTFMMKAVAGLMSSQGFKVWVSMEEHMACGIGICKGCVVFDKNTPPPMKTICKDGPIFDASFIFSPLAEVKQ